MSDAARDERPVLVVTNFAPPYRVPAFAALHAQEGATFALFGGRVHHGGATAGAGAPRFPVIETSQRGIARLAASGRFRAVIGSTNGRVALPASYVGARRAGVPFVLWATLWAQPRSIAGIAGAPVLRHVYRHADAVATYGPHVTAYVRARGARNVFEAPQAVDNQFWAAPATVDRRRAGFQALFVGRLIREKGVRELVEAWRLAGLQAEDAALVLIGDGPERGVLSAVRGVDVAGPQPPAEVRNFYAAADVVVVPSRPTRTFREPWGLVANEAMNQGVPIIATDAVGAAAGGLVRHEQTGLVVPAGDPPALAAALRRLCCDQELRARLGAQARKAVRGYTHEAWVAGMRSALATTKTSEGGLVP